MDIMERLHNNTRIKRNISSFEAEMAKIQRPGMDKLMRYIQTSDFYTAPASTKYHLSTEGGLLQHSLNVLDALRSLLYPSEVKGCKVWEYRIAGRTVSSFPDETIVLVALLHDICKTYFYSTDTRNVKNEKGKWEKVPFYTVNDRMPLGHGSKSAMIIKQYIQLTTPEMYAIWWHMGFCDNADTLALSAALDQYPLIWALHTADMMASHYMEGMAGNKPGFTFEDLDDETGEATMNEHLEAAPEFEEAPPLPED